MSTFHPTRFSLGRTCRTSLSPISRGLEDRSWCAHGRLGPKRRTASDWNQWQAKKNDWGRCEQCDQTPHTTGIEQELCQEYQKSRRLPLWVAFTRLSMKDSWDRKMTGRSGLCFLLVEAWKQDLIRIDLFRAVPHNEVMANQKVKWVPREAIIQLWESDTKIGREPTDGTLKKGV